MELILGMKMKVVFLSNKAWQFVNFRFHLVQALVNQGFEVVAVAPDHDPAVEQKLKSIGVEFKSIYFSKTSLNPWSGIKAVKDLYRFFKRSKPDIVINCTIKPVIYGSLAASFAGVPNIYSLITGLGYVYASFTPKRLLLRLVASILYRFSMLANKAVFFQNPDDRKMFVRHGYLSSRKALITNGTGVDLPHFQRTPVPRENTFIMVSRLLKDKGVHEYVEAAKEIKAQGYNARFLLVGAADANPASVSEEQISAWKNSGVIEYYGHVEDVREPLHKSSVFVLPSYYREGIPRSALEALSVGRAVITTNSPGCRETVIEGENGYFIKPKSSNDLVIAMLKFIDNSELCQKMGDKSRALAEERFDVDKVNQYIIKRIFVDVKSPGMETL